MEKSNHNEALEFYKTNQAELVAKYNGKTIILNGSEILEVKDSIAEAYDFAVAKYGIGNFSLQEVAPGAGSFTSYIASPGVLL